MPCEESESLDVEKMLWSCWDGLVSGGMLPNGGDEKEEGEIIESGKVDESSDEEEGEIKEREAEEGRTMNYDGGVGGSVEESIETEEREFVKSFLRDSPADDSGVAAAMAVMGGLEEGECIHEMIVTGGLEEGECVDEMVVMGGSEEGECVEIDHYELNSFHADGALVEPDPVKQPEGSFLSETLVMAKSSVRVESSPDSPKALPSETEEPLDLLPHAEAPKPMKIREEEKSAVSSTSKALDTGNLMDSSEMLEPRASDLPNIPDEAKLINSMRIADEFDADLPNIPGSVLPMLVESEDPKTPQASFSSRAVQRGMQKIYPRRSKSAVRTFPPGCGRNPLPPTIEKYPNSVGNAEGKRLGDVKTNVQNRVGQTEKSAMSPFALKPPLFGLKVDKEIGSSHKKVDFKSVSTNGKASVKSKFPGKSVHESHAKVEKYVSPTRSNERQIQTVASDRPWNPGKQACRSPLGITTSAQKRLQNMQKHTSKSISRKRNHEEVSSGDSPLVSRSGHRVLSSNMAGLHDLGDKVDDIQYGGARNKVRKALRLFQTVFRILTRDEERESLGVSASKRFDLKAATILKANKACVNTSDKSILGIVPGVEVGDEFHYRVELSVIGLHRLYQAGIDSVDSGGKLLATSIVASGGYDDDTDSSDVLIYSGQGGNPTRGAQFATDQKLERGNLALKNSMDEGTPVRVIRGSKGGKVIVSPHARLNTDPNFTYDGLYLVEKYWTQKGRYGNKVYMFQLRRMDGQPELPMKELKKSKKGSGRPGICVKDISGGKEKIPIAAVNMIDTEKPPVFEYITKMIHPRSLNPIPSRGCQCKETCSSPMNCSCATKNGGRIPFDKNGAIVEWRPNVYECGPRCGCPPGCYNRVSQHGIMYQLEVFKTKLKGWGVRSLTSISSGSFICEYTGEFLDDNDAEKRTGKDEYLFDIGHSNNDHTLWEGLSTLITSDLKSASSSDSMEDVGFTIDAARCGNVGRFINHSCSPNLYAQNVLYDHDDKRMPHIMLFAAENIPPLKELTYNYHMGLDQVQDCDGNIKKKKCHCGSPECRGRMY